MTRASLQSLLLVLIALVLAASIPSYGETAPAGVLPTPVPGESGVSISLDEDTYAPGDRIEITISVDTEQAGFLYVYDIDPAGAITLLYPNRYQPDAFVNPGTIRLPGAGYHFVIGGPEGLETVVAVLSQAAIDQLSPSSKTPFRAFNVKPQALVRGLSTALAPATWTSAWAQFTVYQPKGIVHIESRPASARIRVNGHDRGLAPKDLVLPAGEAEITLSKSGYEPFSETVVVHDQDIIDIDARLQEALPVSPLSGMEVSLAFIGLDLGIDSIGFEVGFTRMIGLSASLQFTEEDHPITGELSNLGPELGLGLRLHVSIAERISLLLGAGLAVQNRATAATPPTSVSPLAITIEPIIATDFFPSFTLGLKIDLGFVFLQCSYHNRRGILFGIGIVL